MTQIDFNTSTADRPPARARVTRAIVGAFVGGGLGLAGGAITGAVIGDVIDAVSDSPEPAFAGAAILGAICAALSGSVAGAVVRWRGRTDRSQAPAAAQTRGKRGIGLAIAVGMAVGTVLTSAYAGLDHGRLDRDILWAAAWGAVFGLVGGTIAGWASGKLPEK
jgi:hypothetical protein